MHHILTLSAALLLSGCLSACSTIDPELLKAAQAIAQDPACGHDDNVNITLGVVSQGSLSLRRHCPDPVTR